MSDLAAPRRHPSVRRALALGVVAVGGGVLLLPLLLGPLAWYLGLATLRDVERDPQRWTGRRTATMATVLGVVASVALAVVTLALAAGAAVELVRLGRDAGYGTS